MVFDASTLILLAKVNLLRGTAARHHAIVTGQVEKEATRQESDDAKLIALLIDDGSVAVSVARQVSGEVQKLQKDFGLAEGEASSLWRAAERDEALATDDGPAIRACKVLGVPFVTAIHFLLDALRSGELSREMVLAKLERLAVYGRYHERILGDAKRRIEGE